MGAFTLKSISADQGIYRMIREISNSPRTASSGFTDPKSAIKTPASPRTPTYYLCAPSFEKARDRALYSFVQKLFRQRSIGSTTKDMPIINGLSMAAGISHSL
jgi:hypothetical protein